MRRCNLRSLVALLAVALLATVLMTPRAALAAPSPLKGLLAPSATFKGKVVAKNPQTNSGPNYFVFTFTCAPPPNSPPNTSSILTGDWTYEVSSTQSFTGTTGTTGPTCALAPATNGSGVTYSTPSTTGIPLLFNGMSVTNPGPPATPATLSLSFTNIVASKTYFGTSVSGPKDCASTGSPPPCVAVQTSDDMLVIPTVPNSVSVSGFKLVVSSVNGSFSTLNLSAQ